MRQNVTWIIPMVIRQRRLARDAGIGASRADFGDVDPNGIRLKEGVT